MSKVKRARAANWEEAAKTCLLRLITEKIDMIENKSSDGKFIKMKAEAWAEIHTSFIAEHGAKDLSRLKEQWRRMKGSSKTNVSKHNKMKKGTGGGPPPSKKDEPSETDWAIKDLLPHEFVKDDNEFDDDQSEESGTIEKKVRMSDFENEDILLLIDKKIETQGNCSNEIVVEERIQDVKQLLVSTSGIREMKNMKPINNAVMGSETTTSNKPQPRASTFGISGLMDTKLIDDSVKDIENNSPNIQQPIATTPGMGVIIGTKTIQHSVNNEDRTARNLHNEPKRSKKSKCSAKGNMTEYETNLLLLHNARITQQTRFEEERHCKQLEVLEAELQYWKLKKIKIGSLGSPSD